MAKTQGGIQGIIWRAAVRKGFWGGQRNWMTVFAVVATVKAVRRLAGSTQQVVYSEELKAGEALLITHHADLQMGDAPK